MLYSAVFQTLVALGGELRADALEELHEQNEQDDRHVHHEIFVAVEAVVDGDLAEAAAADDAAHGRVAEDGRERDGEVLQQRGDAFGDHHLADDLHGRRAHALRGLDDVGVQLTQAALDETRDERKGRDDERNDGRPGADGRADDEARERKDHDHQDQERNRAQQVDKNVQHAHQPAGKRQHAVPFARHEQHAQRQTDHDGEGRGEKRNIEGFPDGGEKLRLQRCGQLLDGLGREKITVHRRSPPRPEDFRSRSEIPTHGQTVPRGRRAAYCRRSPPRASACWRK